MEDTSVHMRTQPRQRRRASAVFDEPLFSLRSPDDRLTDRELSKQYALNRRTLQKWRLEKRGPPFERAERRILYRRGDVETWLRR